MGVFAVFHNDSVVGYSENTESAKKTIMRLIGLRHEEPISDRWDSIGSYQTMRTKRGSKTNQWSIHPLKKLKS